MRQTPHNSDKPDWEALRSAILAAELPVSTCAEFMWMYEWEPGQHTYKHRNTRGSVTLSADSDLTTAATAVRKARCGWQHGTIPTGEVVPAMSNGLTPREHARISRLIADHGAIINHARTELATNFDAPTQRIIGIACAQMECTRLDWEKIVAVQNGWEYTAPPAHIIERWGRY